MKKTKNKYLKRISKAFGENDPLQAVERLVANYRKQGDTLKSIARRLGVVSITVERLPFAGGIFDKNGGIQIKLNSASAHTRQQFTLAHELAHLVIAPDIARGARRCLHSSALEVACDAIAAELLMPIEEMRALGSESRNPSAENVRAIARRFGVSLQAAAVRVREIYGWKHSIGLWKWNNGPIELWYVGRRLWNTRCPSLAAFHVAKGRPGAVRMSEFFERRGNLEPVYLEVCRLGQDHLLALVLGHDQITILTPR